MATYEIPYGTIERPAIPHVCGKPPVPFTEAEQVKVKHTKYEPLPAQEADFEVCAQRWGDSSKNGRGFSLPSRDKYAYDMVATGMMRLILLRFPESPMPGENPHHLYADQGPHDFTSAMFAHTGGWREADTELRACELNYRLHSISTRVHKGSFPSAHSFVEIEPKNLILTAINKADDNDSVVFRPCEFEGQKSQVRLTLPIPMAGTAAAQTNLQEGAHDARLDEIIFCVVSLSSAGTVFPWLRTSDRTV